MATLNLLLLLILLLTSQCTCIIGSWETQVYEHKTEIQMERKDEMNLGKKFDDTMNSPLNTNNPTSSITPTNPANFPPFTPTPTIVTVPASSFTPLNPPITTVPTPPAPVTNPAAPVTGGGISTGTPLVPETDAPVTGGQTWCIARTGAPVSTLQDGLDYACGIGGADCSMIQQGASCYNPNTIENHASYAFNSYFQSNPTPSSCDFGGAAMLVNINPSIGTCIYPSSASQVAMPSSTNPPATTSSTTGATGATGSSSDFPTSGGFISPPPSVFNTNSPLSSNSPSIFGPDSPPTGNLVPASSAALQPVIGFIILVVSFSTGKLILNT